MALSRPTRLTEQSEPQIIDENVARRFVTVTESSITVNITSTETIHRTISYTDIKKFPSVIQVDNGKEHNCDIPGDLSTLVVPLNENNYGSHFTFHVIGRHKKTGRLTENYQFLVRAEMTKEEMDAYLTYILKRIAPGMAEGFFYRNFTAEDEKRCLETNDGFFEMTLKERSGHRSSPLYRRLNNVTFFSCNLIPIPLSEDHLPGIPYLPEGYKFPGASPFGEIRMSFNADKLLNENSVLFLAGMYCYDRSNPIKHNWPHYLSVVVCQKGSISYHTCLEMGLKEMPWHNNPILQWDKRSGRILCANRLLQEPLPQKFPHDVWVEIILCDQPVALTDGHKEDRCRHEQSSTEHRSSVTCQTCHGYKKPLPESSPLKRRSLEQNCETPEKVTKENM